VSPANNIYHAVRPYTFGNNWTGIASAVYDSVYEDYNPTDLVAYWTTTDNLPDVRLWDWYYPYPGLVAWVDCPADNTGIGGFGNLRWCRGQIVRFNANQQQYFNELGREYVACHELGHTVGLRHSTQYTTSCMTNVTMYGVTPNLSSQDRAQVDAAY